MEMLTTLRNIRATIANSSDAANAGSTKELQALKDENERLKKVNSKQEYRIELLVKNMQEMQKKN